MLDFEKMKAALEAEKNRLKMIIEAQEAVIPYLEKFDGKIINKKMVDYLNELDPIRAYFHGEKERKQIVIYHKNLPYNYNTVIWDFVDKISDGKRFDHAKFSAAMRGHIAGTRAELAAIESDLADGKKRAQEFNYVQQYYIKLAKDFSYFIRSKYDHDFKIGWLG